MTKKSKKINTTEYLLKMAKLPSIAEDFDYLGFRGADAKQRERLASMWREADMEKVCELYCASELAEFSGFLRDLVIVASVNALPVEEECLFVRYLVSVLLGYEVDMELVIRASRLNHLVFDCYDAAVLYVHMGSEFAHSYTITTAMLVIHMARDGHFVEGLVEGLVDAGRYDLVRGVRSVCENCQ